MTDGQRSFGLPLGRLLNVTPRLPTADMARTVEPYGRFASPAARGR
jgi:hypothetical protein